MCKILRNKELLAPEEMDVFSLLTRKILITHELLNGGRILRSQNLDSRHLIGKIFWNKDLAEARLRAIGKMKVEEIARTKEVCAFCFSQ
jgi:hypothetical protein